MTDTFVLRHAGRLVTCSEGFGDGGLGVVENGALVARRGVVEWLGLDADLPPQRGDVIELDANGAAVLPGLVDCHTHLVFAGNRAPEFAARMSGGRYSSGGIATTIAATRQADDDELLSLASDRLDAFLGFGTTTVEAKTGYGLTVLDEIRLLDLTSRLRHPVRVVPTLLAAHVVPPEFSGSADGWVDLVCREIIPTATAARFCDAWCDEGAFTVEQSRSVLEAGRRHGLRPKLHAEQLSHTGAAQLAAEVRAVSADHLEHANEADAVALSAAGVIAVLLPGAAMMTRSRMPDARMLLQHGVRVALSTDFNPGTSYSENLQLMVALGCAELGMTVEDAVLGVTRSAAAALALEGEVGELSPGAAADLVVLTAESEIELAYHYGVNLVRDVVRAGMVEATRPAVAAGPAL